jgi:hypothetical protein
MSFSSQNIASLRIEPRIDKVFHRGYFLSKIGKGRLEFVHGKDLVAVSGKGG